MSKKERVLPDRIAIRLRHYRKARAAERHYWRNLLDALCEAIDCGEMSVREASILTGIHRITITKYLAEYRDSARCLEEES